jgi:hypothetical protein
MACEFLGIGAGPDGVPVYWAAPDGGSDTPFRKIESEPASVTFESQAHPYPARIRYRLAGGTLAATIEGSNGDRPMSWAWYRLAEPD